MGPTWRACAVFVAALLIAACGSSAPPTGTTSPAASSPPPGVFVSARYKYTIKLPDGWVGTQSDVEWAGTTWLAVDNPAVDVFGPAGGDGAAYGAAAPTTESLDAWAADGTASNLDEHKAFCPAKPQTVVEPVVIGGQPGTLQSMNCGILIMTAFAVVHGTGYEFGFRDPAVQAATDPTDKATFTTMLASVVYH